MRVFSYVRFSDPKQATGDSVRRQTAYAEQWAKDHGMTLDDTLTLRDEGLSAYHQKHVTQGALGAFLAAIDDGRVPSGSVLIVEGLDRLSRADPEEAQEQLKRIVNSGVQVVTASDGKVYSRESKKANPMDLIYSLILMIRANEESETKSKRVKAAVRRQCEAWIAGKQNGRIVNGRDPGWVRWNKETNSFEHIPERAEAMRKAISLFLGGYGHVRIFAELEKTGLRVTGQKSAGWLYNLIRRPDIIGTRLLKADGEKFELKNYYPPLVSADEYNRVLLACVERSRAPRSAGGKSKIAGLFTGLGVATCGHCGRGIVARNQTRTVKKADGTPAIDRRYVCAQCGDEKKSASVSAKYVERALLNFTGSQVNFDSLVSVTDRTGPLSARLTEVRAAIASNDKRVNALLEASLTDEGIPQAALRKMREMESETLKLKDRETTLSAEIAVLSKTVDVGLFEQWKAIREKVLADDYAYDERMKCRGLIRDTFSKIAFHFDAHNPNGGRGFALILESKTGERRCLTIDRGTGSVCALEIVGADGEPIVSARSVKMPAGIGTKEN